MNELQLKRNASSAFAFGIGNLFWLKLFTRPADTGWMAGIRISLRPQRSLQKAEQLPKSGVKSMLFSLSVISKIDLGYKVWYAIDTNPIDFVSPVPSMRALKSATDELYDAHLNFTEGGKDPNDYLLMRNKEERFAAVLRGVIKYVDKMAKGNTEVYGKAGMEGIIRRRPTPLSPIPNLRKLIDRNQNA